MQFLLRQFNDGLRHTSQCCNSKTITFTCRTVIKLAKQKLHQLEKLSAQNGDQQIQHLRALNQHQGELAFEAEPDALREAIEQLDPDELSPKQALAYLYQLKKML